MLIFHLVQFSLEDCWETNKRNHKAKLPTYREISYLSECLESKFDFEPILNPLLTTRVPGTSGNSESRDYIVNFLSGLGWTIELDTFTQETIIGKVTFSNIIATRNPKSPRRLVLTAHYDTKISPEGFIGATDSAVPCAMLLHLAAAMENILPPVSEEPELTLQLIFFDGEEAFKSWTSTDSLYGSRHLAEKMANQEYTYSGNSWCQDGSAKEFDRIDSFILLDLIGTPSPQFKRYLDFNTTFYDFAVSVEESMQRFVNSELTVFTKLEASWMVSDDQIPFHENGLRKILHMIASPFPSVWHTLNDNGDALDISTIKYLNKIMRVIVYGYLYS